ncbi:DNA translocase FtsK [uncultured Gammaproteobacteria bacterium]|nr:DNA translocase FtsK [uncultured Gammaproteobacteria bacterium]
MTLIKLAKKNKPPKKTNATTLNSNLFNNKTSSGLPDLSLLDVTTTTVTPGPVITQFELSLAPGVKVSQIMSLSKDLARALLVESVRIVDVIPGRLVIGLEIPNTEREMIGLKEILSSEVFTNSSSVLTVALGKDINGQPTVANLAKMPHLLVARCNRNG